MARSIQICHPLLPQLLSLLTGGRLFRSSPQLIFPNHLCCFTSLAPLLLPNLVRSFLSNSRVTQSLPDLYIPYTTPHNPHFN